MIPARPLVLLMVAPLLLAAATLLDRAMLWPMLAADGGIALLAALDALLARPRLVSGERTAPEVFSVGRPNKCAVTLRSGARRPLAVHLTCDLFDAARTGDLPRTVALPGRGEARVEFLVTPRRRGTYELGDHHVRYPSPLRLWLRQHTLPMRDPVRVYPDVQAVRAYEVLARQNREMALLRASPQRGGESEFDCLREYNLDDEYRSIDWKATARRQRLIARQYQLERDQSLLFVLDAGRLMSAESGGLPLFDHALNSALMLGHVAVRGEDRVGLMAFADRVLKFVPPGRGRRATHRLVQAAYDVHADLVESDLEDALVQVGRRLRRRSLVVVFTQVIDRMNARTLVRGLKGMLPRHIPLCVLFRDMDVEAMAAPAPGTFPEEAALYEHAAAAEVLGWRDLVVRDLRNAGAFVLDVAPHALTPALITQYLSIKARRLL